MVKSNIDGKKMVERIFIEEDSYSAVISDVSDVRLQKKFGTEKEEEEKITITFKASANGKQVELPYFAKAIVTKGSGTYSNSKMYELLEKADLINVYRELWKIIEVMDKEEAKNVAFAEFLRKHLIGKTCKITVKTARKGTPDKYSVVDKIVKFGS